MNQQQPSGPRCKWCQDELKQVGPCSWLATFDPEQLFNFELSEEEQSAVEEAFALLSQWKADCKHSGQTLDFQPYVNQQSPRNLALSEHCFDKLLFGGGLVCYECYSRYVERKEGKPANELGLH